MSKFRTNEFQIKSEPGMPDVRVVKHEGGKQPIVEQFEFGKMSRQGEVKGPSDKTKMKMGVAGLSPTDRSGRAQKDRRFTLNELIRGPMSIEDEERRMIEEKVRVRVSALADEAKAKAVKEGYEAGMKEGQKEAYQKFLQSGSERLERFEKFLNEAESAKVEIFRANERYLIELIYRIAKMILLRELTTDREFLLRLTRELIERVGVRENISLRIHPNEKETIGILKESLDKTFGGLKNLNIEVSNQVNLGGCAIETEWNAIDASIETQLKGVYDALVGQKQASGAST